MCGHMRPKARSRPLTFTPMQTTEVVGLGFYGEISLVMAGLSMQVIDYMVGTGRLEGRLLSALPVMRKVLSSKFSDVVFAKWSSNS